MIDDVREKIADILGVRTFEVSPAPFRQWRIRLFTLDRRLYHDIEIDASQLNLRPKALKRYVLNPALEQLNHRHRNAD